MLRGDLQIQLLLEDLTGRVVAAQPARKQHAAPFEPELGVLLASRAKLRFVDFPGPAIWPWVEIPYPQ